MRRMTTAAFARVNDKTPITMPIFVRNIKIEYVVDNEMAVDGLIKPLLRMKYQIFLN